MLILGLLEVPWWGLILLVILGYVLYSCRHFYYFRKQGIPGPTPLPLFGTIYDMFYESMASRDMKALKQYGDRGYCGEFTGSTPTLLVFDTKMLSEIMVKEFTSFKNRSMNLLGSDELSNNMLINLENEHWKHVRNEMTPTFTSGKLKTMNMEINRCAKVLTDNLSECAKLHEDVEMKEYAGGYAMDVIASTGFGIRVDSQKDRNNAFVAHAKTAFDFNPGSPRLLISLVLPEVAALLNKLGLSIGLFAKDVTDFFYNIIRQTMGVRETEQDQSRTDFIQIMMNAQKERRNDDEEHDDKSTSPETSHLSGLSTNEILANAMLFFVAGYDTTAISLSYLLYNLALTPECQQKLVAEINCVVGDSEVIDHDHLQNMPYLEQCINENLRTHGSVVKVNRRANRDATINGVVIKKGVSIDIPIYAIHHDPKKWPEPDKFDPGRFSAENKKGRDPYNFIPFGNGPRICIGMRLALQELKVAAIQVLRKVKVTTCGKTQVPLEYEKSALGLLKAKGGIWLNVSPRTEG